MIDFTIKAYEHLLDSIIQSGYKFYTVRDWIEKKPERGILLRHDVDRRVKNSLETAVLEHGKGIKATYYFRMKKGSFDADIIKEIVKMGHEIGYHYEDLSDSNGDFDKAIAGFEKNLGILREIAEIKTIAMHGKPASKTDNLDLWKKYDFKLFCLTGEAYLSIDYSEVYYFSDTGRSWKQRTRTNFRDNTGGLTAFGADSTFSLAAFIRKTMPRKIALMTHPERWNSNPAGYFYYLFRDKSINTVKTLLSLKQKRA